MLKNGPGGFVTRGAFARDHMCALSAAWLLSVFLFLLQPRELAAQAGGNLRSPENLSASAIACDGLAVGYVTTPVPVPGSCTDYVKECVRSGNTASWQTKNILPTRSRPCTPTTGADACRQHSCSTSTGRCAAIGHVYNVCVQPGESGHMHGTYEKRSKQLRYHVGGPTRGVRRENNSKGHCHIEPVLHASRRGL